MSSDESNFNVSFIVRDKVTRQCPQTTTSEVKGEPNQIRTEVPLFTSLTPYRKVKPAHERERERERVFIGVWKTTPKHTHVQVYSARDNGVVLYLLVFGSSSLTCRSSLWRQEPPVVCCQRQTRWRQPLLLAPDELPTLTADISGSR